MSTATFTILPGTGPAPPRPARRAPQPRRPAVMKRLADACRVLTSREGILPRKEHRAA